MGAMVCAFERRPGGTLYIGVPTGQGGYYKVSLGHRDLDHGTRDAKTRAAKRVVGDTSVGRLKGGGAVRPLYPRRSPGTVRPRHWE
jgi:hypothetical protein